MMAQRSDEAVVDAPASVAEHFEIAADQYAEHVAPFFSATYDYIDAYLADRRRGSVADIACGDGRLAARLAARGHVVVGMDRSKALLRRAVSRASSATFVEGEAHGLPWADGTFDVTICNLSIPLMDDPIGAVRELARITKPSGEIIVSALRTISEPDDQTSDGQLRAFLLAAGLTVIVEQGLEDRRAMSSPMALAGLMQGEVGPWTRSAAARARVPAIAAQAFARRPGGMVLTFRFDVWHATVPARPELDGS
jgi:ubiquinone/menaquinone biosynthesis C-methylase UbiE